MKFRLLIIFASVAVFRCSSVTEIKEKTFKTEKPYITDVERSIDIPTGKSNDYKLRTESREKAHYAILPIKFPEGADLTMVKMLEKEIFVLWEGAGGKSHQVSEEAEKLAEECREKEIDALISPSFVLNDDKKWVLGQSITDPVNGEEYGKLQNIVVPFIPDGKNKTRDAFNQIEIFHDGKNYLPVKEMNTPALVWESRPDKIELAQILKKSVSATLNIGSTSTETEVEVDGEKIGHLPAKDIIVADGSHEIKFARKGKKPVVKKVVLRGGETRNIFNQWSDDASHSSVKIISYPPGLKVAIDGTVRGETPHFENGLVRGKTSVEFLKDSMNEMIVLADHSVEMVPGNNISITLPYNAEEPLKNKDFWKPSGDGFDVDMGEGIRFQKSAALGPGWYGIVSEPILADSAEIEMVAAGKDETDGIFSINIFDGTKVVTVEMEKERVSVYKFPSDGVSSGNYTFDKDDRENPRTVRIVTNRNNKKVKIYLGKSRVLVDNLDFNALWRIGILTRGESFSGGKVIKAMKIKYPELLKKSK